MTVDSSRVSVWFDAFGVSDIGQARMSRSVLGSDNLLLHLIRSPSLIACANAASSICLPTTKALPPSHLQPTTTAVLALPSTTARHSRFTAPLQSLHAAHPTAAVSICSHSSVPLSCRKLSCGNAPRPANIDLSDPLCCECLIRRANVMLCGVLYSANPLYSEYHPESAQAHG